MDRRETHDNFSVEAHLATLAAPDDWQPNPARALAQVRERDRKYRSARKRWLWITATASVICLGVLAAPAACEAASAPSCRRPLAAQLWTSLFESRAATEPAVAHVRKDFRESGSASAPITCEIYSDYECPACAAFFLEIMPSLTAEYVQTGKVRIVHRDLPLPQHRYARLAARYANAAGRAGQYDVVVNQLFRTQPVWKANGDVDSQVLQVLPPQLLRQVRDLANRDSEDLITADVARAREDQIRQTPSLVVVAQGRRQVISPVPSYTLLKQYLDSLLK